MNTTRFFGLMAVLALSFALLTSQAAAIVTPAPGGTPGAPGTPSGPGPQPPAGGWGNPNSGVGKPLLYRGTISAVDASSLTVMLGDGTSVTVGLTSDTRILIPGRKSQGDSLVIGMQVIVWAAADVNGNPVARAVVVIPGKPMLVHRVGTVTDYTPGSSITIQASDGNSYTFALTANTKILPPERAGDLAVGSRVTVIAPRDPGALDWTAMGIVIHPASP